MAILTACGSRAPLDFEVYDQDAGGALNGAAVGPNNNPDGAPDGGPIKVDGGGPGIPDTGIPAINCGMCIASSCGQNVITCVANTDCRDVLQCAMLNCLQGGLDPTCLFKCASSNPSGALQATTVLQCVANRCGDSCISAFGGGGSPGGINGGGGNGGGAPRDGGGGSRGGGMGGPPGLPSNVEGPSADQANLEESQTQRDATCAMLATWPELTCSNAQRVVQPAAK
jgi:hypothetical protein